MTIYTVIRVDTISGQCNVFGSYESEKLADDVVATLKRDRNLFAYKVKSSLELTRALVGQLAGASNG